MDAKRTYLVRAAGAACTIFATAALTACVGAPTAVETPDPNASASTAPSTQAAPPPQHPMPSSTPVDNESTPDASAVDATSAIAVDVMLRFCRPELEYEAWINELYPLLSQQAAVAYETVDPANVPCTAVTGDARVRDGDETYTMRILVPTDAGEYSVYVHRTADTAPWAVEQITPPDGQ